ncbi:MAG: ATP-binding protein [Bdellovibrio sp.]|nr:ATP-binding protein [Bdellovibrio sp.]
MRSIFTGSRSDVDSRTRSKADQKQDQNKIPKKIRKPKKAPPKDEEPKKSRVDPGENMKIKNPRKTKPKKIVLTGGPGVGKTSILKCLKDLNYEVRPEVFTYLFAQAQQSQKFNEAYLTSPELIKNLIKAQKQQESLPVKGNQLFLDRSKVDILGYTKNLKIPVNKEDQTWLTSNDYDLIFVIEPLPKKNYDQNKIRRQTQEESLEHHESIVNHYIDYLELNGRDPAQCMIKVPFFEGSRENSVQKRTQFILKEIKNRQRP